MIQFARRSALKAMVVLVAAGGGPAPAGGWTDAVEVLHEFKRRVSYRARVQGEFLVVQATQEPGWHTYAMDNKQRAEEKLAGRQSLGIDAPTEISLTQGLEVVGPWYQSPPKDLSKPELQWFTWGFETQALFVAKVRRSGPGPARIAVRGQACTDTICKRIDLAISLPLESAGADADASKVDLKVLVQVR